MVRFSLSTLSAIAIAGALLACGAVMPAHAGIHLRLCRKVKNWIPAPDQVRGRLCAGMTKLVSKQHSTYLLETQVSRQGRGLENYFLRALFPDILKKPG